MFTGICPSLCEGCLVRARIIAPASVSGSLRFATYQAQMPFDPDAAADLVSLHARSDVLNRFRVSAQAIRSSHV